MKSTLSESVKERLGVLLAGSSIGGVDDRCSSGEMSLYRSVSGASRESGGGRGDTDVTVILAAEDVLLFRPKESAPPELEDFFEPKRPPPF
jgi:hypothetical protein